MSGEIIKEVNSAYKNSIVDESPYSLTNFSNGKDYNAEVIQKSVRGWFRRTRYLDMRKATNILISSNLIINIFYLISN